MSTRPFISWAYIYSVAFGRLLAFFYAQKHFYNLTRFYIARQHAHVCRTRYCFTNSVCRSVRLSVCLSIVGTVCKQMDLSSYFLDINLCVRTVWHRMTKFGTVTPVGRSIFLGVSHAHIPRGFVPRDGPPRRLPNFWDLPMRAQTVRETTTKFCTVIKLQMWGKFYTVDHECWRAICLR